MTAPTVGEKWVEEPFRRFLDDARIKCGVVLLSTGRVIAQYGFAGPDDVMSVCALASAINASSRELGKQLDGKPFGELHHAGGERQLYMGSCTVGGSDYLFVGVFDAESSVGVVEMYFGDFRRALEESWNSSTPAAPTHGDFEGDLNRSLDALFGPIE
ncbi:MAG: roadblock/LC7 domain-containing protein [Gemmatimonadaceae bacterium]|nr:roadblock/LC7 domain-containing protein [Gemmatimonadaceae bacterium]